MLWNVLGPHRHHLARFEATERPVDLGGLVHPEPVSDRRVQGDSTPSDEFGHLSQLDVAARWFCELDWMVDGVRERYYHGSRRGWCGISVMAA